MLGIPLHVAALVLSFLVYIGLALFVLSANRRQEENRIFVIWLVLVGGWALMIAQFFSAETASAAELWMKAAYSVAILAICTFMFFSFFFLKEMKVHKAILLVDGFLLFTFSFLVMSSDLIVRDVVAVGNSFDVILNPVGWYVYAFYLLMHFLTAHLVLLYKFMNTKDPTEREQLKYVLISVFVGGEVIGVTFNLILPSPIFNEWHYIWIGPSASALFYAPVVTYAILRHRLFNVRTLVKDITVLIVSYLIVLDALMATTVTEIVFRSMLAVFMIAMGAMLLRTMHKEDLQNMELRRLTAQLASANRQLTRRDEMRSEFISIASHQLRTPVSVMKGYLSLMIDGTFGKIPKKIEDKLHQMFEMNERLVLLINNMLSMARIEKNRIEFGFGEVQLDKVIAGVVEEMSYKAQKKGLYVRFVPPDDIVPTVVTDEEKIREVLINLIDNAIKYTVDGGVEVRMGFGKGDDKVTITVSDTGTGMSEDDAKRVFEKFYRAKNARVPKEHGTGLGLYIVTKFVRGLGGRIWISRTAPDEGTDFSFSIPIEAPKPDDGERDSEKG